MLFHAVESVYAGHGQIQQAEGFSRTPGWSTGSNLLSCMLHAASLWRTRIGSYRQAVPSCVSCVAGRCDAKHVTPASAGELPCTPQSCGCWPTVWNCWKSWSCERSKDTFAWVYRMLLISTGSCCSCGVLVDELFCLFLWLLMHSCTCAHVQSRAGKQTLGTRSVAYKLQAARKV